MSGIDRLRHRRRPFQHDAALLPFRFTLHEELPECHASVADGVEIHAPQRLAGAVKVLAHGADAVRRDMGWVVRREASLPFNGGGRGQSNQAEDEIGAHC